ncbi:hypothetical protein NE237_029450 [Protea cynaroides]|uniref:EF-hand domain-containing protein n=1 Tax=Protea cynaroides TaxID=273540 RepID=A0A9Q0GRT8_9MAGN|nr:hypothetical protein NE237_029450 [Protea cynaroides]
MFRMFTQFHNFMEIEYLPIVSPLENQEESAVDFAERTSCNIASALNVVQTSHSYGDSLLLTKALESKLEKPSTYMVEMSNVKTLFNISTQEAVDFLDKFLSMNPDPSGRVKIHGFLRVLRLRESPLSEKIFRYLDVEKQGSVTFRQFFFGSAYILKQPLFLQACELAFTEFDGRGSNYVSQQQLRDSLKIAMPGLSEEEVGELFIIFDTDGDGRVSKDDFMTCLRRNPLLIALFCYGSASKGLLQRGCEQ